MAVRSRVHAQFFLVDAALVNVAFQVRLLLEKLHLVRAECDGEPPRSGAILRAASMFVTVLM